MYIQSSLSYIAWCMLRYLLSEVLGNVLLAETQKQSNIKLSLAFPFILLLYFL